MMDTQVAISELHARADRLMESGGGRVDVRRIHDVSPWGLS